MRARRRVPSSWPRARSGAASPAVVLACAVAIGVAWIALSPWPHPSPQSAASGAGVWQLRTAEAAAPMPRTRWSQRPDSGGIDSSTHSADSRVRRPSRVVEEDMAPPRRSAPSQPPSPESESDAASRHTSRTRHRRAPALATQSRVAEEAVATRLLDEDGDPAAAVRHLCMDVDNLRLSALAEAGYASRPAEHWWDGTGRPPRVEAPVRNRQLRAAITETEARAVEALRVCGAVVIEGVYPRELVRALYDATLGLVDAHAARVASDPSGATNTSDSHTRSQGRTELRLPLAPPFTDARLVAPPVIMRIVEAVTGTSRLEIDTFSTVTSEPGTPAQHWHRDIDAPMEGGGAGGALEAARARLAAGTAAVRAQSSSSPRSRSGSGSLHADVLQLPASGVVEFVTLQDVGVELGPTTLLTGTHLRCGMRDRGDIVVPEPDADKDGAWTMPNECPHLLGATLMASAPAGSAVLFDPRLMHRGGTNMHATHRRPQIYLSYFATWFVDRVNFGGRMPAPEAEAALAAHAMRGPADSADVSAEGKLHPDSVAVAARDRPRNLRKLLSRAAERAYVDVLEARLRELGVDVSALAWRARDEAEANYFLTEWDGQVPQGMS